MKLLSFVFLAATACATTEMPYVQQVVQNQASVDFDCDQGEIKVSPVGPNRYVAAGCLQREVYTCNDGWFTFKGNIECKQKILPQE